MGLPVVGPPTVHQYPCAPMHFTPFFILHVQAPQPFFKYRDAWGFNGNIKPVTTTVYMAFECGDYFAEVLGFLPHPLCLEKDLVKYLGFTLLSCFQI